MNTEVGGKVQKHGEPAVPDKKGKRAGWAEIQDSQCVEVHQRSEKMGLGQDLTQKKK